MAHMVESDPMLPPTFTWAIPPKSNQNHNTILSRSRLGGVGVDPRTCKTGTFFLMPLPLLPISNKKYHS